MCPIHAQLTWYVYCILFAERATLRPYNDGTITLCVISETDRIRCVYNSKFTKDFFGGTIIKQDLSVRQYTVLMQYKIDITVRCVFPIR